jgi:hypothetical protein
VKEVVLRWVYPGVRDLKGQLVQASTTTIKPLHEVSPCHHVTVSPCHRVTVSPCHRVTSFEILRWLYDVAIDCSSPEFSLLVLALALVLVRTAQIISPPLGL